jgi:large subunit ribosomal protein L13
MKTFSPKPTDYQRVWWVLDADGQVLGRLAVEAAKILRGKHKPVFAPHADTGDYVVVINAKGIRLTGKKPEQKMHTRHSGFPGGLRQVPYERLLADRPSLAIELAVKGMLPHNRLGRAMFKKLRVYDGAEHPHGSQNPKTLAMSGKAKGA